MKQVSARLGITLEAYAARVSGGQKWYTFCHDWHVQSAFPIDRTRFDGLRARCLAADRGRRRGRRDPQREAARHAVQYAIRTGRIPHPDELPCVDCRHVRGDGERRHEYDHHQGYEKRNWLAVEAVCTLCHADREKSRG